MEGSYVVTGGGRGIGRAIAERLVADGGSVVIIEMDGAALRWIPEHAAAVRLSGVTGSAAVLPVDGGRAARGPDPEQR